MKKNSLEIKTYTSKEDTNINKTILKNNLKYIENLEKRARKELIKRYEKPPYFYDAKMINDILYNEKTHYVEMFKEYLLYEDYNEFLRQYYSKTLVKIKLKKILNFYEKYSKIFPNYTALKESKYFYKNIKRKQKVINQINENKRNENSDENSYSSSYNKTIFNSRVINSIYTGHNTITINKNNENNLTNDDKSICDFINQISNIEKNNQNIQDKNKKLKKDKNININTFKNDGPLILKKLSNLLVNSPNMNSNYNINNNSCLKNKIKIDFNKKIIPEKNISINNINNKIISNPYNYISKQKSFSNIINPNKKKISSIKYNNYLKKNISSNNNNNIFDTNKPLIKKNISNNSNNNINSIKGFLFNNNNNVSNLKNYLDYEKYKKILLSTNSTNTPKMVTERMFSSPGKIKNIKYRKKRSMSNTRKISENKIIRNNDDFMKRNSSSYALKKNQKNLNSNNNILKNEKNLFKCQINKQNKKRLINNYNPDSINKLYNKNISHLSIKNRNTRKNNAYNNKNKIVNNYNIMNGIMNNSTQINIFTGNDLIKSLNLYWNSIINSTKSPSPFYDSSSITKKKINSKSLSRKNKKIQNMKQFIEKHMKEKKLKEPYTERTSSNDKLLKLLDIYCRGNKKHRNTNFKKNYFNKNKLNISHNYKTKSKSNCDEKSIGDFLYRKSNNIDVFKDKDKNNSVITKNYYIKKNKNNK